MYTNALYWFETQLLSRGYCCSPLLRKQQFLNYFPVRVVEFWLCIQAAREVQAAAPWASWRLGDCCCATRVTLCQLFGCFLCFLFHWICYCRE